MIIFTVPIEVGPPSRAGPLKPHSTIFFHNIYGGVSEGSLSIGAPEAV